MRQTSDDNHPDFGDQPHSKKQIRDLAYNEPQGKVKAPFSKVEVLLGYNEELAENGIISYHGDLPQDLWVIGTNRMIADLSHASGGYPLSVDPTFNHGAFEVTPVTYRHQHIEAKSRNVHDSWSNAVMVGLTIIHHSKTKDIYDTALRAIARKTSLSNQKIGIVTDGEAALISACKNTFKQSIGLRCTNQFKENCKDYLKSIGIIKETDQGPLLDIVFGEDGLVEAEDKKDLRRKMKDAVPLIDALEKQCLRKNETDSFNTKFSTYLLEREKEVLRKLSRDNRRKGGMPLDRSRVPARVFTNQSETVNSMLSSHKIALGYSKKEDLSKAQFIKDVWEEVVSRQDANIERALFGQSEQYQLTEEAKYLEVEVERWYNWTEQQRKSRAL